MHIIAQCPRCRYRWWLNAAAIDRRTRCPKCFLSLRVPDPVELADATGIIGQARSRLHGDDAGRTYG